MNVIRRHCGACIPLVLCMTVSLTGTANADEKSASKTQSIELTGISLTAPAQWERSGGMRGGPMAPKAILTIPALEGDSQTGMVRVTYFPGMKGKDELNVNRWLGQVQQADGRASTRDNAKITEKKIGDVKLTIVDVSGSVRVTMREKPQPGGRLIAAIVDHPKGPHFVVVAGNAKLIAKNEKAIYAFLESAKAGAPSGKDPHAGHGHDHNHSHN